MKLAVVGATGAVGQTTLKIPRGAEVPGVGGAFAPSDPWARR
jgi:hypothetical protein